MLKSIKHHNFLTQKYLRRLSLETVRVHPEECASLSQSKCTHPFTQYVQFSNANQLTRYVFVWGENQYTQRKPPRHWEHMQE